MYINWTNSYTHVTNYNLSIVLVSEQLKSTPLQIIVYADRYSQHMIRIDRINMFSLYEILNFNRLV